jgi:hypothetical protein
VEARYGSASDSHKEEREELAFNNRATARHELREVRELDGGMDYENADDQNRDRSQLDVG